MAAKNVEEYVNKVFSDGSVTVCAILRTRLSTFSLHGAFHSKDKLNNYR